MIPLAVDEDVWSFCGASAWGNPMTSAGQVLARRSGARGRATAVTKARKQRCRVIVMCSPKGGTGKTTFTQNLLPLMAQEGLKAIGVDLDPQGTLSKWFARRE